MRVEGNTIIIPQGDTETLRFTKKHSTTMQYKAWDVAKYELTIASRVSKEVVFSSEVEVKQTGVTVLLFPLSSEDTNIAEGDYVYGLRKLIAPNYVHTEILENRMKIVRGVKKE